jgi:hypothetical protein
MSLRALASLLSTLMYNPSVVAPHLELQLYAVGSL